jgi:hypothetical protein
MTDLVTACARYVEFLQFCLSMVWYALVVCLTLVVVGIAWQWADRMKE